jgi:signal transduction histidine kinase
MRFTLRWRIMALGIGLALMGILIVAVTINSERQAHELRNRLELVDLETVGIEDQFKAILREANDRMREFRNTGDPAAWEGFEKASHELEAWVQREALILKTAPEKKILGQIDAAYAEYLRLGEGLRQARQSEGAGPSPRGESTRFFEQARRLSDLGQFLARSHSQSRDAVLAHANVTLSELRQSILWSLGLLFLLGMALAWSVYRQMIAPLQSRLVESEALAQQNEKLAALGMLAAGVAHEIRNPLTAIKAALFIQQKRFKVGSVERSDVELVEREILRLERIVNQFLQFARPADPELRTVEADLPLQEVEALLRDSLDKVGIQLVREPCASMRINADLAQIKQVLINLVQNGADSMDGQGTITLRARFDRKRLNSADMDVVILEVADTGTGIPPEIERRIFDPFFTTKDNGTGLGLAIAARIVQKHGGALHYHTQAGRGTTFGLVLPRAKP